MNIRWQEAATAVSYEHMPHVEPTDEPPEGWVPDPHAPEGAWHPYAAEGKWARWRRRLMTAPPKVAELPDPPEPDAD